MKLIEADKAKRVMKDYWKAQVDKALTLTFTDSNEANKRINSYLEHNHELLKAIDELPSVQPERKTGRWTLRRVTYLWEGVECEKFETRCSSCGRLPISGIKSTYCPNCGADMRGEGVI